MILIIIIHFIISKKTLIYTINNFKLYMKINNKLKRNQIRKQINKINKTFIILVYGLKILGYGLIIFNWSTAFEGGVRQGFKHHNSQLTNIFQSENKSMR